MVYTCICTLRGVVIPHEKALELVKQDAQFLARKKITLDDLEEAEEGGFLNEIIDEFFDELLPNPEKSIHNASSGEIIMHHQGCCSENSSWVIGVVIRKLRRASRNAYCQECTAQYKSRGYSVLCDRCIGLQENGEFYDVETILKGPVPTENRPTQRDEEILRVVQEKLHLDLPLQTVLMLDDCLSCT
jgi:hypothetical protein